MAVSGYAYVTIQGDYIDADLLCWRYYKTRSPGILERMLDDNPHLARLHKKSPFLPVGTQVRIPIDVGILRNQPKPRRTVTLFGRV